MALSFAEVQKMLKALKGSTLTFDDGVSFHSAVNRLGIIYAGDVASKMATTLFREAVRRYPDDEDLHSDMIRMSNQYGYPIDPAVIGKPERIHFLVDGSNIKDCPAQYWNR